MVQCQKCNKTISDPDDLNVMIPPWAIKTYNYCNNCAADLSKKWKAAFFAHPMNSARYILTGLSFIFLWLVFLALAIIMTLAGDPQNLWAATALFTIPVIGWFVFWIVTRKKLNEVKNTPKIAKKTSAVSKSSKSVRCSKCQKLVSTDKINVVSKLGLTTSGLCNDCFAKQRRSLSGALFNRPYAVPLNSKIFNSKSVLLYALFIMAIFLLFSTDDSFMKFAYAIAIISITISIIWRYTLVYRTKKITK